MADGKAQQCNCGKDHAHEGDLRRADSSVEIIAQKTGYDRSYRYDYEYDT